MNSDWYLRKTEYFQCPICQHMDDPNQFVFLPDWAFSDLGFSFWSWDEFIEEFKQRLTCDVTIVYWRL